jgi:hypothetical protein
VLINFERVKKKVFYILLTGIKETERGHIIYEFIC